MTGGGGDMTYRKHFELTRLVAMQGMMTLFIKVTNISSVIRERDENCNESCLLLRKFLIHVKTNDDINSFHEILNNANNMLLTSRILEEYLRVMNT